MTPPKTTIDSNRPAYGGTCYSPFSTGTVYTLSYFNNQSFSGTAAVTFKATDNAFAHVIEGHKLTVSTTSTSSVSPRRFLGQFSGGIVYRYRWTGRLTYLPGHDLGGSDWGVCRDGFLGDGDGS